MSEQANYELPVEELVRSPEVEPELEPEPELDLDQVAVASDSVRLYLRSIGKVPLLKPEEEVELARRTEVGLYAAHLLQNQYVLSPRYRQQLTELAIIDNDGQQATAQMYEANLRLVVSIAKKYAGGSLEFLDVIQEGNIGLMRGVEKFDYQKGFKFSTYATWWIRQAISRGMAEQARTIRVPVHMNEQINKINRVERDLVVTLGRQPTEDELSFEVDIPVVKLREIKSYGRDPISLQAIVGDNAEINDFVEDADVAAPSDIVIMQDLSDRLREAVSSLLEREAYVINSRFGLKDGTPRTLDYIATRLGLTRERIRQIEVIALNKLRHPSRTGQLRNYLETE